MDSMDTKRSQITKGRNQQKVGIHDRRQSENEEGQRTSQKSQQREVRDQTLCQPTIN